jgi:hypothetical protein
MPDLATRITTLVDTAAPPIDVDALARDLEAASAGRLPRTTRPRWLRPAVVFGGAFVAVAAAVGIVALVGSTDDSTPVGDEPPVITEAPAPPSLATTLPPPATEPPASEPPAPVETQPPVDAAPEVPFDYEAEGTAAGTLDTPLGSVSWYVLDRISSDWIEAGFPGPYGQQPGRDFWEIWGAAHSGLEVFETEAGYLGLGSTVAPDEPRIMTGYRDMLVRVRGAETLDEVQQMDADSGAFLPDEFEAWANDIWGSETEDGGGSDFYFFAADEVWFSPDGSEWVQVDSPGLGEGAALESQPGSVAYHDGTWMVIGWTGVDEPLGQRESVDGAPAAWMSDDLATWTRVPFEFPSTGTDTELTQVIAGDRGWLIVGTSRYEGDRATWAATLWVSADGLTWEEVRIEDLTGLPGCPRWALLRQGEECHFENVRASFVPGGIALYVNVPTYGGGLSISESWRLWLGAWGD